MDLIQYLQTHFFTREQLLTRCAISADQLHIWQGRRMMPQPSYRLHLNIRCDSFFGKHHEELAAEYYAKAYANWIEVLRPLGSEEQAFAVFARRYRDRLDQLANSGMTHQADFTTEQHLAAEWRHFLDGSYGLCTVSGLPEDIAVKELAIAIIREADDDTGQVARHAGSERLRQAIDLLDTVSSPFAPHEVARSSRHRYVDAMRARHKL